MQNGNVIDTFEEFINPGRPLSATIIDLTGITDAMLANTRTEKEVITIPMKEPMPSLTMNARKKRNGQYLTQLPLIKILKQ